MFKSLSGKPIPQRQDELEELCQVFKQENVTSYLEIGSRYGDSFYNIVTSLPQGSCALAIDLPGGIWGRDDSASHLQHTIAQLKSEGYDAKLCLGDSTSDECIEAAFMHGPFDAIMIDGDHRFEGLTLDWINYKKFSNKLVVFHDIDGHKHFEGRTGDPIEVPYVWNILKRNYRYKEIVSEQRGMGIGVLWI